MLRGFGRFVGYVILSIFILERGTVRAADPDFGPNVYIFDPTQPAAQEKIHAVFKLQERAQFGLGRYALLFKPGKYELDVPVGFFTHVAGLGALPDDVIIHGGVWTDAGWMGHNATCNFWRIAENLAIKPTKSSGNTWAVSQAAPIRRLHVIGDLNLAAGGWSSGGFMADCRIDGHVRAQSQQQWFSRNSQWQHWDGGAWNIAFAGCQNPPDGTWPERPFTTIAKTHHLREKPFLAIIDGQWKVMVPPLRLEETSGVSWDARSPTPVAVPIESFHIARADRDTAVTINAALSQGKHLLITPGVYHLDDSIAITRPGTIVLGLGLPSLVPMTGQPALRIDRSEGTIVSGLMIDASPAIVDNLVVIGIAGQARGDAANPATLHDLYCRVGGNGPGKAKCMVTIHDHHVIGDNLWLWRADHGKNVGWTENVCANGLIVNGDDVTMYGLFVEHTQAYQTIWNGNGGRVYFYQSELPYDPPSAEAWHSAAGAGYASYKVNNHVTTHQAWALGVYHVIKSAPVMVENGIETPAAPGIKLSHMLTYRLSGGKPGSGITHVINGIAGESVTKDRTIVLEFPQATSP